RGREAPSFSWVRQKAISSSDILLIMNKGFSILFNLFSFFKGKSNPGKVQVRSIKEELQIQLFRVSEKKIIGRDTECIRKLFKTINRRGPVSQLESAISAFSYLCFFSHLRYGHSSFYPELAKST